MRDKIVGLAKERGFGPIEVVSMEAPGHYWRFQARASGEDAITLLHAGDGPKHALVGEPESAKPRRRLRAEARALGLLRPSGSTPIPRVLDFDRDTWTLAVADPAASEPCLAHALDRLGADLASQLAEAAHRLAIFHAENRGDAPIRSSRDRDLEHVRRWAEAHAGRGSGEVRARGTDWTVQDPDPDPGGRAPLLLVDPDPLRILVGADGALHWRGFELAARGGDPAWDLGLLLGRLVRGADSERRSARVDALIRRAARAYQDTAEAVTGKRRTDLDERALQAARIDIDRDLGPRHVD